MFEGVELKEAGYERKQEEMQTVSAGPLGSENNPSRIFPSMYTNSKEMPLDLAGAKAGDKFYFCGEINISEISRVDREGVTEPEPTRFTMEFLKAGIKPMEKSDSKKTVPEDEITDSDPSMAATVKPEYEGSRIFG